MNASTGTNHDRGSLAGRKADELLPEFDASATIDLVRKSVAQVVTEHPAKALLGAFAFGFVVARLVRAFSED